MKIKIRKYYEQTLRDINTALKYAYGSEIVELETMKKEIEAKLND